MSTTQCRTRLCPRRCVVVGGPGESVVCPQGAPQFLPFAYYARIPGAAALLKCPCCQNTPESIDHVLQCSDNPSQPACLVTLLRKALSFSSPRPVFHLLLYGFAQWLMNDSLATPDITSYPSHLHFRIEKAMSDQQSIGWDNAARGFLSIEWRSLASEVSTMASNFTRVAVTRP